MCYPAFCGCGGGVVTEVGVRPAQKEVCVFARGGGRGRGECPIHRPEWCGQIGCSAGGGVHGAPTRV
jgi:hypothetical protein